MSASEKLKQRVEQGAKQGMAIAIEGCDYCGRTLSEEIPVVCEAFRYNNFPDRPTVDDGFLDWVLTRARCQHCETTAIESGTFGVDEALVRLSLEGEPGSWIVKDAEVEVLDYSSTYEGFERPAIRLPTLIEDSRYSEDDARQIRMIVEAYDNRWLTLAGLLASDRMDEAPGIYALPERSDLERFIGHLDDMPPAFARKVKAAGI
ncbi:hypothetical protein [Halomarina rubra]|uniref:HNH endonuclease n=1 Tax=Halomarina rubra TaxID=2071873 RepID=A0ABD6AV36_9EURY|nr:hypothetical protein [Halomarina rubra]